jgi:hypothetical protein
MGHPSFDGINGLRSILVASSGFANESGFRQSVTSECVASRFVLMACGLALHFNEGVSGPLDSNNPGELRRLIGVSG